MLRAHPCISVPLSPIPGRQRVRPPRRRTLPGEDSPMESAPAEFPRPTCGFQRHSSDGLARHRTACHGHRPDVAKTGQRELCEETVPHLRRRPAPQAHGKKHGVDAWEVGNLCFTKKLAQLPLESGRHCPQQRLCAAGRHKSPRKRGITLMLVAGASSSLFLICRRPGLSICFFFLMLGGRGLSRCCASPGRLRNVVVYCAAHCSAISGGWGSSSHLRAARRRCTATLADSLLV
ncbi:dispersed gene family protein 1 (DGF-1), partial [Trypanosoma cruzi]